MEKGDDEQGSCSNKTKHKKKSLCRILMQRRTKVGCLSTDSEEFTLNDNVSSVDKQINKTDKLTESSEGQNVTQFRKENQKSIHDQDRSPSMKEIRNSTKLSLCCAMTESSKSSHYQHSNYHRVNNDTSLIQSNSNNCASNDLMCTNNKNKLVSSNKTLSEDRSTPESHSNKVVEGPRNDDKELNLQSHECGDVHNSSSLSLSASEISSCDSSPVPITTSQTRFRRHLVQRRSADNLFLGSRQSPSLRHSSPDSSKSAPETHQHYKTRSASHEPMAPQTQKGPLTSEELNTDKTRTGLITSMDSLARHSLLAAQVLHLIPTTKARERNFLHGRIAANSLLGLAELEKTLPQRELRIFVGTWNMNGQAPPRELNDFMLPAGLEHVPDIIAVGTQESYSERFEWEVHIQETVGPSHLLFHSAALGTLHLAIYMRRDLLWFCSVPEESSYSVRPGTAFRTKGAVAIAFMLFGTSYLFITAHLTAHVEKVKERIHDVKRIIRSLDLPKLLPVRHKSKDVTQNFDYVFWCGDLNFRLSQSRDEVIQWVSEQNFPMPQPHLLQNDQLRRSRAEGSVFRDFEEGPITFQPTYKYDPGTQIYDSSHKQRIPAYTDRILFKSGRAGRRESNQIGRGSPVIECLFYMSVPSICTSDHKPVWGLYRTTVRPGIDTIPLAAGLFNREVYLEGIKRRAAALGKRHDASSVCSIQ
uniref:phosphoinositide 5-phosphatase n=1 Tax=Timema cristinae TaxID=61476 RepID=A0A7R9GPY7_TIMCR|nr:unnamed protein product [Timema cristinae]